ncbi:MAG: barstar family protein [Candidatus Polarisedimenticolia bacterium]
MTVFEPTPDEWSRLDYRLLRDQPVTLYYSRSQLEDDLGWFNKQGYKAFRFVASGWSTLDDFHHEVATALQFPDYYGRNLDAFNDCLSDMDIGATGGTLLVFVGFEKFAALFPREAWAILDIIAHQSRRALLHGRRLVALVQTNDPHATFDPVGAMAVGWNPREWSMKDRGL